MEEENYMFRNEYSVANAEENELEKGFRDRFSENIEPHYTMDVLDIWRNMIHLHHLFSHKTLFLMGLSTPDSFHRIVENKPTLPESFLRKDDLFYEDVNIFVEKCFGGCSVETQECMFPDDGNFSDFQHIKRAILTSLDDLSNNGLYDLAKLVTRGLVQFEKTRLQMKRVIKSSLLTLQSDQYSKDYWVRFQNEVSQLLRSPKNFLHNCGKHVKFTSKTLRDDVVKVLDRLKEMRLYTLSAINRKLRGGQRKRLQLNLPRVGVPKEALIKRVRRLCLEMLDQLGESDELPEPLLKAMAVAGLSLNLSSSSQDLSLRKFVRVAPEIKTLQDEIMRAIKLLDQKCKKSDMKKIRHLLDPDSKAESRQLTPALRYMLTEFLFDTVDMAAIPESLLGVLSIINKRPMHNAHRSLSKDLMNGNVECILNTSASLRQLMWECDPSNELEHDFVEVYMDELEESDDGDLFDDSDDDQKLLVNSKYDSENRIYDSSEEVGSTSYADDVHFISPSPKREPNFIDTDDFASSKLAYDEVSDTETKQRELLFSKIPKSGSSPLPSPGLMDGSISGQDIFKSATDLLNTDDNCSKQNLSGHKRNRYIALQDVCDNTSKIAFQLIGHVLSELGQVEGLGLDSGEESYLKGGNSSPLNFEDSQCPSKRKKQDPVANSSDEDVNGCIVIEAIQRVLPSFPKSHLEKVKEFLSS